GGTRVLLVGERDPVMSFVDEGDVVELVTALLLEGPGSNGESTRRIEFASETGRHTEIIERMAQLSGLPLTVERVAVGEPITTVPGPAGTTVTHLLTLSGTRPDDAIVTPEVSARYGIEPRGIDDFLQQMFA